MGQFNKQKYDNEYAKNNYDRCIFNVPKGYKQEITEYYKKCGYTSLNQYVTTLIQNDMDIARKEFSKLSAEEQLLLDIYRYTTKDKQKKIFDLALQCENEFTSEEKQKLISLRRIQSEMQENKIWNEDFGHNKPPKYIVIDEENNTNK